MRRRTVLGALVAAGALSIAARGFQAQTLPVLKVVEVQRVKGNLYLLKGGGGNTAVFVTELGVVLVDTKLVGWGRPMLDAIKTLTTRPVTAIINTHAHGDHTGSNESFGTAVEIVAHENTRTNMERMEAFKGDKVNFLPKLMFKEKLSMGTGADKIDLYYFGAGHTSGDAWVVFPALRVLHAGDMFAAKEPPLIDTSNGGSGLAYPESLAKAAATLSNVEAVITGHGGVMTWKDLEEYARFNRDFRDVVVDGFNRGLGVADIADAWRLPARYKDYTAPPARVRANVQAILGELTR